MSVFFFRFQIFKKKKKDFHPAAFNLKIKGALLVEVLQDQNHNHRYPNGILVLVR